MWQKVLGTLYVMMRLYPPFVVKWVYTAGTAYRGEEGSGFKLPGIPESRIISDKAFEEPFPPFLPEVGSSKTTPMLDSCASIPELLYQKNANLGITPNRRFSINLLRKFSERLFQQIVHFHRAFPQYAGVDYT